MAKKIRFPLEMDNGVEVRSMEELRENFSLSRVLGYFADGKLITWLRDRYANDLADAIEELDKADEFLAKKICEILGVEFDEESIETLEQVAERNEKLAKLKEVSSEKEFIDNIDIVAFDQDDLYDLLDEGKTKIYLCGERFSIPLSQEGITYVGINNPVGVIDSKVKVDWTQKNINLKGVSFDKKYQEIENVTEDINTAKREKVYDDKLVEVNDIESEKFVASDELVHFVKNNTKQVMLGSVLKKDMLKLLNDDYGVMKDLSEAMYSQNISIITNTIINISESNIEFAIKIQNEILKYHEAETISEAIEQSLNAVSLPGSLMWRSREKSKLSPF